MNNLPAVKAGEIIDSVKVDIAPLLAESGQSFDRLRSTFIIAAQQNPSILRCTPESIRREISKCASDGLVPDGKQAVLLPYKGEAQYQPMVYGIIKRMRDLAGVFQIICKLVYEADEFSLDESDPGSLSHRSNPFSKNRGEIIGGYVILKDDAGRVMHFETMSREDFNTVRRASKAPDSPAWKTWFAEMCRKALVRRASKYISINNDKIHTLIERTDAMFDFSRNAEPERVDPFGGQVITHMQTIEPDDDIAPSSAPSGSRNAPGSADQLPDDGYGDTATQEAAGGNLSADVFRAYHEALRLRDTLDSLQKAAKHFWADKGGFPKFGPDADLAKAINEAHKNRVDDKTTHEDTAVYVGKLIADAFGEVEE